MPSTQLDVRGRGDVGEDSGRSVVLRTEWTSSVGGRGKEEGDWNRGRGQSWGQQPGEKLEDAGLPQEKFIKGSGCGERVSFSLNLSCPQSPVSLRPLNCLGSAVTISALS